MKLAVISLLIAGSTAWTPLAPRGRAAPTRAWSGSSDGGSEGRAPLDRRQLLSAVAVATAFFAPRAAQALDLPTFPKMSLPSAPSLPTLPTLDDLQASAEATGEAVRVFAYFALRSALLYSPHTPTFGAIPYTCVCACVCT